MSSLGQKKGRYSRLRNIRWLRWLVPIVGLFSLIWFLIRVIPKPSRATYPCQRVAFPLASSFVIWLTGIVSSTIAFNQAKGLLRRSRRARAVALLLVAVLGASLALKHWPHSPAGAAYQQTPNAPIGVAKGVCPGRVVWVHDPEATDWVGYYSSDHWYDDDCTDQWVVEQMMSKAVRGVGEKALDVDAWDAIFRYHNQQRGKGDIGYQTGEKITIKINLTCCNARSPDPLVNSEYNKYNSSDYYWPNTIDNSPHMLLALLRHLVYTVGIDESDITIGDPTCIFPNHLYNKLYAEFPNVVYLCNRGDPAYGRTKCESSTTATFNWSTPDANGTEQDYLPESYAEAEYLINFAVLKSHSAGVTVCAKNHYGSLLRCPDGYHRDYKTSKDYYDMHLSLPHTSGIWTPGTGHYRALVDLMGHEGIGGKTVLYLVDGLFAGEGWTSYPSKWQMQPFNDDWPSSLFASMDPVAIDSVCWDFLATEWSTTVKDPDMDGGSEDYLHEAALADNPPSGTVYDPENDGNSMPSLGVHEHWDSPSTKQYSRNLGTGDGIELFKNPEHRPGDFNFDDRTDLVDYAYFADAWQTQRNDNLYSPSLDMSGEDYKIDHADLDKFNDRWLDHTYPADVNNNTPSDIDKFSAKMNGEVTDIGGADPNVYIYWGQTPGTTDPNSWDYEEDLGEKFLGDFDTTVVCDPDTTYYYRCYVENACGGTWADGYETFTTLEEFSIFDDNQDIGTPSPEGSAIESGSLYWVYGGGPGIVGTSDHFHMVYKTVDTNVTIEGKIVLVENTDPDAVGGIMIRDSFDSQAPFVMVAHRPDNQVLMKYRTSFGGTVQNTALTGGTSAAKYIKLDRTGSTFQGHYSSDGENWTPIDSISVSLSSSAKGGLVSTSNVTGTLCVTTFSNVIVND